MQSHKSSILESQPLLESMPVDFFHLIVNIPNSLVDTIREITNRCFRDNVEHCGLLYECEGNRRPSSEEDYHFVFFIKNSSLIYRLIY